MAITIESYSTQANKSQSPDFDQLEPTEHYGRVRASYAEYTVPAGTEADGNNVAMVRLPENARILEGYVISDDLGSGKVDVGLSGLDGSGFIDAANTVADDDDFFGVNLDTTSAGTLEFAATAALNKGYKTEKECWLVFTVETAVWAAAAVVRALVYYVVD